MARFWPSLANYADEFIFIIAGRNPISGAEYDSVDMYTISTDTWKQAPSLNQARDCHSSCVAARNIICVFGGFGNVCQMLNSLELIDAKAVVRGDMPEW